MKIVFNWFDKREWVGTVFAIATAEINGELYAFDNLFGNINVYIIDNENIFGEFIERINLPVGKMLTESDLVEWSISRARKLSKKVPE